ncbi:putative Calreticulin family protein [Monocercomonoides exilis]|uniref:putative Calreticulin family protein n=1 Tax=Monocercomonoides exilis TaxID=2049356 RepID=UPI003559A442|nr:putative Calreticulin family protein [Monocercomonoides exilis]
MWAIEEREDDILQNGNKGLVAKTDRAFHGCSTKFMEQLKDDDLIIQYEVKGQRRPFKCGGEYIKVFNKPFRPERLFRNTSYSILFGPDRCGTIGKIVFILRIYNQLTREYIEHQLTSPIFTLMDGESHVYRLTIRKNDTFTIMRDKIIEFDGWFKPQEGQEELFDPPIFPKEMIPDPSARKPRGWDEREYIDDPDDVKPADWAGDRIPQWIDDPEDAGPPENWNETEEYYIPDADAAQPIEWNEEEDGVWERPMIPNPRCPPLVEFKNAQEEARKAKSGKGKVKGKKGKEAAKADTAGAEDGASSATKGSGDSDVMYAGCGKYQPAQLQNPEWPGEWRPRKIKNPKYNGTWSAPLIKNPLYHPLKSAHDAVRHIFGVGFDLWEAGQGVGMFLEKTRQEEQIERQRVREGVDGRGFGKLFAKLTKLNPLARNLTVSKSYYDDDASQGAEGEEGAGREQEEEEDEDEFVVGANSHSSNPFSKDAASNSAADSSSSSSSSSSKTSGKSSKSLPPVVSYSYEANGKSSFVNWGATVSMGNAGVLFDNIILCTKDAEADAFLKGPDKWELRSTLERKRRAREDKYALDKEEKRNNLKTIEEFFKVGSHNLFGLSTPVWVKEGDVDFDMEEEEEEEGEEGEEGRKGSRNVNNNNRAKKGESSEEDILNDLKKGDEAVKRREEVRAERQKMLQMEEEAEQAREKMKQMIEMKALDLWEKRQVLWIVAFVGCGLMMLLGVLVCVANRQEKSRKKALAEMMAKKGLKEKSEKKAVKSKSASSSSDSKKAEKAEKSSAVSSILRRKKKVEVKHDDDDDSSNEKEDEKEGEEEERDKSEEREGEDNSEEEEDNNAKEEEDKEEEEEEEERKGMKKERKSAKATAAPSSITQKQRIRSSEGGIVKSVEIIEEDGIRIRRIRRVREKKPSSSSSSSSSASGVNEVVDANEALAGANTNNNRSDNNCNNASIMNEKETEKAEKAEKAKVPKKETVRRVKKEKREKQKKKKKESRKKQKKQKEEKRKKERRKKREKEERQRGRGKKRKSWLQFRRLLQRVFFVLFLTHQKDHQRRRSQEESIKSE